MLTNNNIEINAEFKQALNLLEDTNNHIFITGRAGTGKSTLLQYWRNQTKKNIVVVAPTGIAALNVKGQTIHSFFGLPPHPLNSDHIHKRKEEDRKMFSSLDAIVIDEVSMVRADLLDAIDYFMRINGRTRSQPFGGVQMIFIGDLFQLPPVISTEVEKQLFTWLYDTPFFFSSNSLHKYDIKCIELITVYRQKDRDFLQLLDRIRIKNVDYDMLLDLNKKRCRSFFKIPKEEFYITLTTTNATAQKINDNQLAKIEQPAFQFEANIVGDFPSDPKNYPTEATLNLKEGAQIMFVRNDQYKRWVNGSLGRITYIDQETIKVSISEQEEAEDLVVHREEWSIVRYKYDEKERKIITEEIGSFNQYPIKLAWAVTIHKSQGKTFDKIVVDIGRGAFAPGQVYVALSRCTTLEGIVLRRPIRVKDVIVDDRVLAFAKAQNIYEIF